MVFLKEEQKMKMVKSLLLGISPGHGHGHIYPDTTEGD